MPDAHQYEADPEQREDGEADGQHSLTPVHAGALRLVSRDLDHQGSERAAPHMVKVG